MKSSRAAVLALVALAAACRGGEVQEQAEEMVEEAQEAVSDAVAGVWDPAEGSPSREELERGRNDPSWMEVVQVAPAAGPATPASPERWEQITPQAANTAPLHLPAYGDVAGPTVLRVQVLLDRALFSPGIMDGRWGKNTAKAVYWLQKREGLPATARVDSATFTRLAQLAGEPREIVRAHRLTAEDVKGPFEPDLPEDWSGDAIYEVAKKPCTCYRTLTEKLTELFHLTPELLQKLNPGVNLDALTAGQTLNVPNVRAPDARAKGKVARLVVSGIGSYVHAVDAGGRILYHFPSTLGATYDPSPQGSYSIRSVTRNPSWHFQPAILEKVPDDKAEAMIPAGPNNAVGVVWMALSAPHYGIHGTNAPETIGYASSAGCVRLTNWDVHFLAGQVPKGTPVEFRDTRRGGAAARTERPKGDSAAARSTRAPREEPAPKEGASRRRGSREGADTTRTRRDTTPRERPDTTGGGAGAR